jgi:hypothetical protein
MAKTKPQADLTLTPGQSLEQWVERKRRTPGFVLPGDSGASTLSKEAQVRLERILFVYSQGLVRQVDEIISTGTQSGDEGKVKLFFWKGYMTLLAPSLPYGVLDELRTKTTAARGGPGRNRLRDLAASDDAPPAWWEASPALWEDGMEATRSLRLGGFGDTEMSEEEKLQEENDRLRLQVGVMQGVTPIERLRAENEALRKQLLEMEGVSHRVSQAKKGFSQIKKPEVPKGGRGSAVPGSAVPTVALHAAPIDALSLSIGSGSQKKSPADTMASAFAVASLVSKCSKCQHVLEEGSKFCPQCGTKVPIANQKMKKALLEMQVDEGMGVTSYVFFQLLF